jgi:hypothetical protein
MTRVLRYGSLIGGLMLAVACGTEQPTAPSALPIPPTITVPLQQLPVGEPVATYVTPGSQYLLYGNGVFGLRYDAFAHVYLGSYRQDYDTILFMFGGASTATGTLKEDLLEVRYSDIMVHSDFENAIYRRSY